MPLQRNPPPRHEHDLQIETVKYQVLDSLLLNEVQRQQRLIEQQQHEIDTLKAKLNGVSARIAALESTAPGKR